MRRVTSAECGKCGKLGPEAEHAPEALDKAQAEGWLIGRRPEYRTEYCPDCRGWFEPRLCTYGCTVTAIYKLTGMHGETVRSVQYACGRHVMPLEREMFAGSSDRVIHEQLPSVTFKAR